MALAFRPFSRQDIIARLGGINGNYDPRKTHWENAGTEDVLGREETDWPDATFGKGHDGTPSTPPSPGMGGINPLDPAAALPEQYSPASTYNPDMAIPGVGSFIYGPGNMVMQNIIPQAQEWPTRFGDVITGTYNELRRDPKTGNETRHKGLDIGNNMDDPAYAAIEGTIDEIFTDEFGRNNVMVRDKYGNLYGYTHNRAVDGLKEGMTVSAGDRLAISDGSGGVRPHLHMTFRQGTPTAPAIRGKTPYSDPNLIFQQRRGRPIGWNTPRG